MQRTDSAIARKTIYLLTLLFALSVYGLSFDVRAQTCSELGGTAYCVGPEVGPYQYNLDFPPTGLGAHGPDEASAIAGFIQVITNSYNACTLSLDDSPLPPWQSTVPIPSGTVQEGNVGDALSGTGTYWGRTFQYYTETYMLKIPMIMQGTYPNSGTPPCNYPVQGRLQMMRRRDAVCPDGFSSGGSLAYCYRNQTARSRQKNFLQCGLGNPTNPAIGNKVQVETDYVGTGPLPLRFVRTYDNQLYMDYNAPPTDTMQGYWSRLGPNWRSTYDRAVRFTDAANYPTAYVYRPEGRTLSFKLSNGQFVAEPDINDRLVRLTDGSGQHTGWRYTTAEADEVELYDAAGKLLSITNRAALSHTLAYDSNARLATVTDTFGRSLTFTYDGNGSLQTMTDSSSNVYTYAYNSTRNVTSVTYPGGSVKTYVYNESQNTGGYNKPLALTGIIDESGSRFSTYKYSISNTVTSTEHAGGVNKHQFSYSSNNTQVTDPLGTVRTYLYTNIHGMAKNTALSQPCTFGCDGGSSAATAYDVNGNAASRTDFRGNKTCYAYDLARNLETVRLEGLASSASCPANPAAYIPAAGTRQRKISTQWHATYRLPTQIDELGKRTTFTHDANGNVLTRTELDTSTNISRTWTYTHNNYGQVLTADGPRTDVSDVTTYTYYICTTGAQCGQAHTVTNAASHVTTYNTYNAHGQPLTMTDPNGVVTTLAYDPRQRLTSRTVGTEVTTFGHWPTGLLKKVTLPDSSYLEYTYDAAHRLADINDADGNRIHYTLDAVGNRTGEQAFDPSNALTRTRTRVFDTLSRLQQEIGAAGTANVTTTFGYDNNGNQTSIVAPLGRDTTQGYDELNRLTQVTDPLAGITQYGYNALDQLVSVTDPKGLVTSYSYNALGDLGQQTSADTGVTVNTYDSGGNLKTSTDARNAITTYTYDALNRVASTSFAVGSTIDQTLTYSYDAGIYGKGRLTGVSDSGHSLSWSYDAHGRLLTAGQIVGTVSKTTSYAYANGQRQSMTTPSGQLITYGYANGKLTSINVNGAILVSNILYDPFALARQWTWGNGTLSVRTFDQDGKITQIDSAGLKTYAYDDAFRITGITDTTNTALSWTYGYDDLDRLTSASKTGMALGFSFDANGNRLAETGSSASTFSVAANSNRLSSTSGALVRTYGYDNAGNTTSFTGISFTYNSRGRMNSLTKAGVTSNYAYNGLGQRVKKYTSGTSTYFVYDEEGRLVGEYNNTGGLTQETVWMGDTPIATLRPKTGGGVDVFYVHTDHLNTPIKVSRPSDNRLRWRRDVTPHGVGTPNQNPENLGVFVYSLRAPGQVGDAESGLFYNYYRDYDPATGRYVESDPIGLGGGINTYAYVLNNPVMHVDPFGLKCGTGWSDKIVSDSPFGIDISDCCQAHDDCYDDCFNSPPKSICDQRFRTCIYQKCAGKSGIDLWTCHLVAEGYPWGLDNRFGDDAFRNARARDPKRYIYGGVTIGGFMTGRR